MKEKNTRTITLSTKVTAEQKALFTKIAAKNNISLSEWMVSIIEMHQHSYDKIGDPTQRETELEMQVQKKEYQINRLKAQLESADNKVNAETKRADEAVLKRDEEILKLKKITLDYQNLRKELNKITFEKTIEENLTTINYNENKTLILPAIGFVSIFLGLILGKNN
jgi:hypothetical protein